MSGTEADEEDESLARGRLGGVFQIADVENNTQLLFDTRNTAAFLAYDVEVGGEGSGLCERQEAETSG